jgi:beta-barrel assembly-enhancing protease
MNPLNTLLTVFTLFLLLVKPLQAQDFQNYKPIKFSGSIPEDFLRLSSEKYALGKTSIDKSDKAIEKKTKKKFFLESSFGIQKILYSGKVLFNDPVTTYLNQIADKLLQQNPAFRKEIRIYAVKSASVNALTTNDGIILVNLGLLSQMESEAQIAFVLAHEIIHYQKKHVINGYVETQKVQRGKGVYKELSFDDRILAKSNYSKELETEADLEGLDLYLKSDYSIDEIQNVFDILHYAYLPFDEVKFEKSFLEFKNFTLSEEYFLESVNPVGSKAESYDDSVDDNTNNNVNNRGNQNRGTQKESNDDDKYSTHPSTMKRKEAILSKISGISSHGKKKYLMPEDTFLKMRKVARFEIANIYLMNQQYEQAIYHSYLLLKEDSSNVFLRKVVAKSLYALSRYHNDSKLYDVHESFKSMEGESQQVYHLVEKMPKAEFNLMALKYAWNLQKELKDKASKDEDLEYVIKDLLYDLTKHHYPKRSSFFSNPPVEEIPDTTHQPEEKELSKIDKIKKNKVQHKKNDMILYALVDELKDSEFVALYDEMASIDKNPKKEMSYQQKVREKKRKRVRGERLGIDKVVLVNPLYTKVNLKKKEKMRYVASEQAQIDLNKLLLKNAQKSGLEVKLLARNNFEVNEGEMFEDFAFLNQWISEKFTEVDNEVILVNLDEEKVRELIQKYKTPYFCWMAFAGVRVKKSPSSKVLSIFTSVFFPPLLLFTIPYLFTPQYESSHLCLLFNIQTGELVFEKLENMETRDSDSMLNSNVYDTFYQMNRKKK